MGASWGSQKETSIRGADLGGNQIDVGRELHEFYLLHILGATVVYATYPPHA
jgi:hypothetical protein